MEQVGQFMCSSLKYLALEDLLAIYFTWWTPNPTSIFVSTS
jgi:hypothetical protein